MARSRGIMGVRQSIKAQLVLGVMSVCVVSILPILFLSDLGWQNNTLIITAVLCASAIVAQIVFKPLLTGITALETGLLNFKDGEFSSQLAYQDNNELGRLSTLYNQTAEQLRKEKQWIYQRELMLDKVLQSSPEALLLVDDTDTIVFSNHSTRHLFAQQQKLEGQSLKVLLSGFPTQLQQAITKQADGLFTLSTEDDEHQTWHLACGKFLLNNRYHTLFIFKHLTKELSRQEVAVWKKVIRIISHELNNSLGPMSSMLHSGKILTAGLDDSRLQKVFSTIEGRIEHLNEFIQGYGKFAKLPQPKKITLDWPTLLESLEQQWVFTLKGTLPLVNCSADQTQLEQLLINLLKNAHESGSQKADITLEVTTHPTGFTIIVRDKGKGMNEQVMSNALIPFYSTKANGSGLGLALCREIAEAHNGHITIQNTLDESNAIGGLMVKVFLPT